MRDLRRMMSVVVVVCLCSTGTGARAQDDSLETTPVVPLKVQIVRCCSRRTGGWRACEFWKSTKSRPSRTCSPGRSCRTTRPSIEHGSTLSHEYSRAA
jgi:hypothetical protein